MNTAAKTKATGLSLKARLGIGAALLGAGTLLTALILYLGMTLVAERLDTALASETRMARYATLSTQAATFLVVATEAIQTGQDADSRAGRIAPVAGTLRDTFARLRGDVEDAVAEAETLGIDAQSRYGTQSLGLARMEALLASAVTGLTEAGDDRDRLRAHIDTFATAFDPLLNQAVNTEVLFRNDILRGIEDLRRTLSLAAIVIAALTVMAVLIFQFGLIRPQFRRLDRLRDAAARIRDEDFAVALPATRGDEIGRLYSETNRMAAALQDRQTRVEAEWTRLNEVIEERTEALSAANARLEEIDDNRRRFFADISHELRTPLTVILMEAQIGRQGGSDTGAAFATIEARAARLNRRIDDLLRVARSDSGQLALDKGDVDLAEITAEIVEEIRAEIDNAGMTLRLGKAPALSVRADRNWLRQSVVGLIRNAIRHARDGGVIALDPVVDQDGAGFAITDNGPGIAAADQERVFDRFTQSGSGNAQGFGMGLALAHWVTEAQGGQIVLTSPLPRDMALGTKPGTRLTVTLPLSAPPEPS